MLNLAGVSIQHQPGVLVIWHFLVLDPFEFGCKHLGVGNMGDMQPDQVVEGFHQIDMANRNFFCTGLFDLQGIGSRVCKFIDIQQGLAATGFHIQQIMKHVVFLQRGIPGNGLVPQGVFIKSQVVQGVFVGFQPQIFETLGYAGVAVHRFTVFPGIGIDHLGDTRLQYGVKVVPHFNKNVPAATAILPIQIDYSVTGGARACEIVENINIFFIGCSAYTQTILNSINGFWVGKTWIIK